jgi:hypothetical protein
MSGVSQTGGEINSINGHGIDLYHFAFAPNGTGTVDATTVTSGRSSGIASITYNKATALYSLQLVDTAPGNLIGFYNGSQTAVGGNLLGYRLEVDYTNSTPTTGLIVVRLVNGSGSATATAASTGELMYGLLLFSKNPLTTN